MIVWCLQHHLLIQMHTYISLAITDDCENHLFDPFSKEFRRESHEIAESMRKLEMETEIEQQKQDSSEKCEWPPLTLIREKDSLSNYRYNNFTVTK